MTYADPLPLTPMQLDCARVIHELTVDGVPPTYGRIARELGLASKSGVCRLVDRLESRGWLSRRPWTARTLRLLYEPPPIAEYDVEITAAGQAALLKAAEERAS